MTLSLRERRRQMLHDDMVQAMTGLLADKSYAGISMDELAGQVGISKPTLYSHFATKEDILVATIRNMIDHVAQVIESDQAARSPFQQLLFILETIIQMQVNHARLARARGPPRLFKFCARARRSSKAFMIARRPRSSWCARRLTPARSTARSIRWW